MKPLIGKIREEEVLPQKRAYDIVLPSAAIFTGLMITILLFGIIMLYSTSFGTNGTTYLYKQLQWTAVGFAGFFSVVFLGFKRISDWSLWLMIGVCILLVIADLSPAVKGAHRWIKIPKVGNIQPSEYAKVVLSLFLAKFLSDRARYMVTQPFKKVFLPCGFFCSIPLLLVIVGKDLGTTILLSFIVASALFISGIRLLWIILPVLGLGIGGFIYVMLFDSMRWGRMTIFMNPEVQAQGKGYQLYNSLLALGSGNWFGRGFTESRMKMWYLPEAHTDFILSIVGEELGFISLLCVVTAYIALMICAVRIARNARTRQGMLLAFCIGLFIGAQAVINMGVICGAFPTKGMPAPFISYGGSNLVTCLTASGLVLSVALDTVIPDYPEKLQVWFHEKWKNFKRLFK